MEVEHGGEVRLLSAADPEFRRIADPALIGRVRGKLPVQDIRYERRRRIGRAGRHHAPWPLPAHASACISRMTCLRRRRPSRLP